MEKNKIYKVFLGLKCNIEIKGIRPYFHCNFKYPKCDENCETLCKICRRKYDKRKSKKNI